MRLFLLLALLFAALGVETASAVTDSQYFYKAKDVKSMTPARLADIIECDRAGNPDGRKIIDAARCGAPGDRASASPLDYLVSLERFGVRTVDDLIRYLRTGLRAEYGLDGRFLSDCLKGSTKTATGWKVYHKCLSRPVRKGEAVWVDVRTDEPVFLSGCTNPGAEVEVIENCVYFRAQTRVKNTALEISLHGPGPINDRECPIMIQRPGTDEWVSPWTDECINEFGPGTECPSEQVDAATPGERIIDGSFDPGEGWVFGRGPRVLAAPNSPWMIVLCLKQGREYFTHAVGLLWSDYVWDGKRTIASVWYTEEDARTKGLPKRTGEPPDWWHWLRLQ